MYTKLEFGKDLKDLIAKKQKLEDIGAWSYTVYLEYTDIKDTAFSQLLQRLCMMELGSEFAFSYDELNIIADTLIAGKDVDIDSLDN